MNTADQILPTIKFKFNPHKQLESLLWLANQSGNTLTKYYLLKMLYYAEKYHLNHYGRPVFGDVLCAMPEGPVPSLTYDLIKNVISGKVQKAFSVKSDNKTIHAHRTANKDLLSSSDIKALQYGWKKCKALDYPRLKKMSHEENDYKKAWNERGSKGSNTINLNDTLDSKTQTEDSRFVLQFSKYIKL